MDVLRSLLLIAFLFLIWNIRLGTAQPIRDFFEWGRSHLFLFVVNAVMIGIVWGFVGREYGLQGLFLQDNAVLEFLAGTMVMLLFLRMDLQHFVLDESQANWTRSVERSIAFLLGTAAWLGHEIEIQRWLRDGFLEHLTNADLAAIQRRLKQQREEKQESTVADFVQLERFRLLFSPAVLLVSALVLLPILGLMPAIGIPLASGEDLSSLTMHLPWLLGTITGAIAGVWLASWSARRLDAARMRAQQARRDEVPPGWSVTRHRMLSAIKQEAAACAHQPETVVRSSSRIELVTAFLLLFFLIHCFAPLAVPQLNVLGSLEPLSGDELRLWWPLTVLALEAVLAIVALLVWKFALRAPLAWGVRKLAKIVYGIAVAATPLERRLEIDWRARLLLLYLPMAVILVALNYATTQRGESVWRGVGATLLVALFLGSLSTTFSLGTVTQLLREARPVAWARPVAEVALYVVAIVLWQMGYYAVSLAISLPLLVWLANPLLASGRLARFQLPTWQALLLGGILAPVVWLAAPALADRLAAIAALSLALALILLGGAAMRNVVRSAQPLRLYSLSAVIGFLAFAIGYNGLPEIGKSQMPSAISIVCLFGVIASLYTLLAASWKERTAMVALGTCGVLLIISGNAWFRTPNQFKLSFPGLEQYYRAPAVFLNSESYFRDTMPSVVKLYYAEAGPSEGEQMSGGDVERLAAAQLSLEGVASGADGLDLTVREFAGRIRPRAGDRLRAVKTNDYQPVTVERSSAGIQVVRIPLTGFLQSRIYREFHDMTVQFMRSGAPVGTAMRLSVSQPAEQRGTIEPIRDLEDEYAARLNIVWAATWEFDAEHPSVILRGLPNGAVPDGVEQVALSTRWNGVVLSESSWPAEGFRIRLQLLRNAPAFGQEQLDDLRRYLTNCYLVHQRPTFPVDASGNFQASALTLLRTGDCVIVEDVAPESPVLLGTFVVGSQQAASPLSNHILSPEVLTRRLAGDGQQIAIGGRAPKHQVRIVYDRGLFVRAGRKRGEPLTSLAIYNGDRIRRGDRLVLNWSQEDGNLSETGGVFTVVNIRKAEEDTSPELVPGYWLAEVQPDEGAAALPEDALHPVGDWQILRPLDNYEALQWWQKSVGRAWRNAAVAAGDAPAEQAEQVKPPLVIVTVSGGGIRASVWTVAVLRQLEQELGPAFPRHVRLITGASGGMVGGTYYAGTIDADTLEGPARPSISLDEIVARMASDQLDSVIGQFVFADIPGALNPFPHDSDRGKVLEATWKRLAPVAGPATSPFDRRIQSYAADELLGRRPSMVYTPMMVEDGRRLLISNLDLSFVARNLGGMLLEPESRKINHLAYFEDKSDREILLKDDVISLSAVEFFRIFPDAHDFRMSTAMRMSASFPWVSPAVSLPTSPPRRVVDAAYYDNYGVNMAAMWLTELRDWLAARTSGVVVIQIRDHISQTARTNLDFDRETPEASQASAGLLDSLTWQANRRVVGPGSQAVTTPLSGITSARQWTMSYRNDEQVELLDELFGEAAGSEFFRTVVFECPIEASLSWNLSIAERSMIENGFGESVSVKDYFGADAAEHARWQDENRAAPDYPQRLKARFDEQLQLMGFTPKTRGTLRTSEQLYRNVLNNRKRLVLLKDWWDSKRRPLPTPAVESD